MICHFFETKERPKKLYQHLDVEKIHTQNLDIIPDIGDHIDINGVYFEVLEKDFKLNTPSCIHILVIHKEVH